jgi:hypothetical protein
MGKESITLFAKDGAIHDALHVTASIHLGGGDVNLIAVAIGVLDCSSIDNAIETCPERSAHAHGARFAGGVESVTGKRERFEALGGFAYCADLSVGTGVELLFYGVQRAQQQLP